MPQLATKYFGQLDYPAESIFEFASGIPAFEKATSFVFLDQRHTDPLIFMQSLIDPELCFITVPVSVADRQYQLQLSAEDLAVLGFQPGSTPRIGTDLTCLALVTVAEGAEPTANLASPIVLNLHNRKGTQVIQDSNSYSFQHRLLPQEEPVLCS